MPLMQLNSVVLPAPLGPISPQIWLRADIEGDAIHRHDAAEAHHHATHPQQRLGRLLRCRIAGWPGLCLGLRLSQHLRHAA